ncbi:hypothetical protein B0A50_08243 [Salinomyces thailandicus]|uniref:N-acetyltransferase domain-containing protein n=1 Tax=Salinomyces thailandicus TaxID=706561 RepID=A0A4U0TK82_9PEZI|nr:hypothetical protein B0A50_08243 [Salinomyces thailandica]
MPTANEVKVTEARQCQIESLKTIVARGFHPVNPYIRKVLPDTPLMRDWWAANFTEQLSYPNCKLLTVLDENSQATVGLLALRLMAADERGSGSWTTSTLTPDHNEAGYRPMIDGMTEHREQTMLGTRHYMIELFCVDHACKGSGIGGLLIRKACETADEAQLPTFVQANGSAKDFYCKLGFEEKARVEMPGDVPYSEFMLLRPCRKGTAQ